MNQYAYAYHDPLNAFDPTGELAPLVILGGRLLLQYLACNLACHGTAAAGNLLSGGCANWKDNIVGCGTGCLLSLIPIKLPPKLQQGACGINSFEADTLVHVKSDAGNGGRLTTALKRIADIQPGDEVLALAEWETADTALRFEKVLDVYSSQREQTLVRLTLESGEVISATEGHPLSTPDGWRDAILIKRGGKLLLRSDSGEAREASVVYVQLEQRVAAVYNLEVANAHTFFVGEDGVLVHNARRPVDTGVYILEDIGIYVGQSIDIDRRETTHKRTRPGFKGEVCRIPNLPDKNQRNIIENFFYDSIEGLGFNRTNKIRPPKPKK